MAAGGKVNRALNLRFRFRYSGDGPQKRAKNLRVFNVLGNGYPISDCQAKKF